MRFVYIILLVVILVVGFSGCKSDLSKDMVNIERTVNSNSATVYTASVTTVPPIDRSKETPITDLPVSSNEENSKKEEVIIKATYEKPLSLKNKNTILLDGVIEGEEYIEVIIKGEIFDFEQATLNWDESVNGLKEKEVVKRFEKLKDQIVVIKTYQPEGIPSEKIKWKSRSGKAYEYVISEKSLGDIDNSISKFEIH